MMMNNEKGVMMKWTGLISCRYFNQSHTIDIYENDVILGIRLEGFDWYKKRLMVYISTRYTIP